MYCCEKFKKRPAWIFGRPRLVCSPENIDAVSDLVLSQEGASQTHRTIRQIQRETGMSRPKGTVNANRLLRTSPTFSHLLMVSVAVSKLGCTELFFVEPELKINDEYYRNVLLMPWRRCCQRSGGCQATSSSSSRTAPQHIEQRTPLRCCDVKHQTSLDPNSGQQTHQTSIQSTTEFGG